MGSRLNALNGVIDMEMIGQPITAGKAAKWSKGGLSRHFTVDVFDPEVIDRETGLCFRIARTDKAAVLALDTRKADLFAYLYPCPQNSGAPSARRLNRLGRDAISAYWDAFKREVLERNKA